MEKFITVEQTIASVLCVALSFINLKWAKILLLEQKWREEVHLNNRSSLKTILLTLSFEYKVIEFLYDLWIFWMHFSYSVFLTLYIGSHFKNKTLWVKKHRHEWKNESFKPSISVAKPNILEVFQNLCNRNLIHDHWNFVGWNDTSIG